ncbi:hypothetical protein G9A89_011969 [Geosiphon pyriformis]|nr:hypothetical protein G9A89_011969 [Geosiphon pyriformis]
MDLEVKFENHCGNNSESYCQKIKPTLDSKENPNVASPEPQRESSLILSSNELSTINLNINTSSATITLPQTIVSPNTSISSSFPTSPTMSTPLVIPPIRAAHRPQRSVSIESLPQYSTSINDKPPKYYRPWTMDMDPFQEVKPSQSKNSWSITKKLYFFGFFLWPIWIAGSIWICAKEKEKRRWCE